MLGSLTGQTLGPVAMLGEFDRSDQPVRDPYQIDDKDKGILCLRPSRRLKGLYHEETPIGAVVVHDGKIVGRGFNQVELTGDPSQHAEMVAIQNAAKTLSRWRLYGLPDVCDHGALPNVLEP